MCNRIINLMLNIVIRRIYQLKLVIPIIIGLYLFSCNKQKVCCDLIDIDVKIHYQDTSGNNLINTSASFNSSNIKIYFKNGDQYEYAFKSNLDNPNFFSVVNINSKEILTVFPSNYYEQNRSTTLIELNSTITDTLICEFDLSKNNTILKQAWLNGIEIKNRYIEVKK